MRLKRSRDVERRVENRGSQRWGRSIKHSKKQNASWPRLEVENLNQHPKDVSRPNRNVLFNSESEKTHWQCVMTGPQDRRTLTSSLWLMDSAECSSALMTDAYESENLVYFPTRAMEHCSSSRSDLHRETFNVQHSRFMLCDVIVCAKKEESGKEENLKSAACQLNLSFTNIQKCKIKTWKKWQVRTRVFEVSCNTT